jgi:hypothetical protein
MSSKKKTTKAAHDSYKAREKSGRPMICVTLSAEARDKFAAHCAEHGLTKGDAIARWLGITTTLAALLLASGCNVTPSPAPENECPTACDEAVAPCETYQNNVCAHTCLDEQPCFTQCEEAAAAACMSTDESCVAACPVSQ